MIRIVIEIDIDEPQIGETHKRRIVAKAPAGYTVSQMRCAGWGRTLETGAVNMDFAFKVTSPADLLPRVDVYGTGIKK